MKFRKSGFYDPKLRVIRLERHSLEDIYKNSKFNKNGFCKINQGSKIAILSYGHLLHRAVTAVRELSDEGVDVSLFDIYSIKPIPNTLKDNLKNIENIITYEEQCLSGGFGSSILDYLNDNTLNISFQSGFRLSEFNEFEDEQYFKLTFSIISNNNWFIKENE